MIHQYKLGGFNIVLDVCSGAVHVVDEVAYDMIAMFEEHDRETIIAAIRTGAVIKYIVLFSGERTVFPGSKRNISLYLESRKTIPITESATLISA